jgi:hypothetical protein
MGTTGLIDGHGYAVTDIIGEGPTRQIIAYNPHGENHPRPLSMSDFEKYIRQVSSSHKYTLNPALKRKL